MQNVVLALMEIASSPPIEAHRNDENDKGSSGDPPNIYPTAFPALGPYRLAQYADLA